MAAQNFRVIFTESAWEDIGEVVRYWTDRDEPERGEQYAYDLPTEAIRQLSDPDTARAGRHLRHTAYPAESVFDQKQRGGQFFRRKLSRQLFDLGQAHGRIIRSRTVICNILFLTTCLAAHRFLAEMFATGNGGTTRRIFVGRFCETPFSTIWRRLTQTPYNSPRFSVLDCVLGTVEPPPYKNNYHG